MLEISFSVRADTVPGQVIKIVGSSPELGNWETNKALLLDCRKGFWEGSIFEALIGSKLQFKLIKVNLKGIVQWQTLPSNSNRKFKPKCPSQLHLIWSKPEGRITALCRSSYKLKGLPGVMINRVRAHDQKKSLKKQQQFDPYRNARDQQSGQSDQEEFMLVRRKMSDEIAINSGDLQEIYYNSSPVQIFCGLLKKIKIYVISKDIDPNFALHNYIQQSLGQMPSNYLARWITADCLLSKQLSGLQVKLRRRGSLFEVGAQELHLQSLHSRTSYFIFLQLQTALGLQNHLGKVPTCLFLPASAFKDVISVLPQLTHIQLICFDQPSANKTFYEYLRSRQSQSGGQQSEGPTVLSVTPSIQAIIKQLQRLRYRQTVIVNTLDSISEIEGLKLLSAENTINIIDANIIDKFPKFVDKIIDNLDHHSLLIAVAEGQLSESMLQFRDYKNVILIYSGFQKVILQGKQYHPLRKFRETLEMFRMKSKLYLQNYGGDLIERQSSIIYILPQGKQQWAIKVEGECLNVVKQYGFIKVSRKGTRVKMGWNLARQARLLRTLCEIKYINYGPLGNFNLVTETVNLKELKDDIRLLIEHKPKLFLNKNETTVSYSSYGNSQLASYTIIPLI